MCVCVCVCVYIYIYMSFGSQQPNSGLGRLVVGVSRSHTHTHGRTPLDELSARRRCCYLHNTHQTQQTIIHAFSGIRTRDPDYQVATDLCPGQDGHQGWLRDSLVRAVDSKA